MSRATPVQLPPAEHHRSGLSTVVVVVSLLGCWPAATALASPSMIRVGYPTCVACHLSPQGRGLLTDYGKGVDEAESARGNVFEPAPEGPRRVMHDLRLLTQIENAPTSGSGAASSSTAAREWLPLARLWYRHATFLSERQRLSATVSLDLPSRVPPGSAIEPATEVPRVFISRAMWEFRPRPGLELAVGRDVLPSGVEIADQSTYMRARNEQGFADVPTQAKLFWWSSRFQVTPYVFGPSGLEPFAYRAGGGGILAEAIGGRERFVVGVSARASTNQMFDERLLGLYARAGFGRWALLSEWDLTMRRWRDETSGRTEQITGFGQVAFYPKRWLITSLAVERLQTGDPIADNRLRARPEIAMRLTSNVTIAASMREQVGVGTAIILNRPAATLLEDGSIVLIGRSQGSRSVPIHICSTTWRRYFMTIPSHVPVRRPRATLAAILVLTGLVSSPGLALANDLTVRHGQVAVVCPLTIGGRFEAKTSAVTGRIAISQGADALEGSFLVDLRTLDTGIALRDTHLKETYLEVSRGDGYDTAVLDRIRLIGADAGRAQGKVSFQGMLMLHGTVREVQGTVDIARNGPSVKIRVQFPLRIDAFQFAKPTYLGVGVSNEIRVEVHATLADAASSGPSR